MRILSPSTRRGTLLMLVIVGGCVPQPPKIAPPLRPPSAPVAAPSPAPLPSDWRDRARTPGTWTYRHDARGSIAAFGPIGGATLVTLRCDTAAKRLYLARSGTATASLTVRTTSLSRLLPVQPTGDTPPIVAASIDPRDPLLDAIGFSRGRIAIEQPGTTSLIVPPYAEVERVTQDCRG